MFKFITTILAVFSLIYSTAANSAGDPAAGQQKSAICAACHGADGNSVVAAWPSIAGQHQDYFLKQMLDIQKGVRKNDQMAPIIAAMTEQDFQDLAAYFSGQVAQPKEAAPETIEMGERIYRAGNNETGLAACMACHGPNGIGNSPASFPAVRGQQAEYTTLSLKAYRSGERANDQNAIMRDIAAKMTDAEIAAVANYIMGLN
ncbi:MAG: cytochrome c4 [Gammaproteobacteria bacterium]|nr:MAG: cytochrome c4 [Gammaproteobacteria bacterium]